MNLNERLQQVAVLGAGGKMGSGIALLTLQEMSRLQLQHHGRADGARLHLVDASDAALDGLQGYLRNQLVRWAEKNINALRSGYATRKDLVENGEMIQCFTNEAMANLRPATDARGIAGSRLIFEAIVENAAIKIDLFKQLKELCGPDAWFLTNTSSIPIQYLDLEAGLNGRIIGFHFYNPPAVQKLVEVISAPATLPELSSLAEELGRSLRKILVPSNDVAGFIGNGHFMRDLLFGLKLVEELEKDHADQQAAYMVNKVSQDFMIRPMGILQLIDYVGLDVCQLILTTMREHLGDTSLHSPRLDKLLEKGVRGGQNSDGTQKNGLIQYVKNKPAGFYCLPTESYVGFSEGNWETIADQELGPLPEGWHPWKTLLGDKKRADKLKVYFSNLFAADSVGARLAVRYLQRSREISNELVSGGIAARAEDVNQVLENGFFHIYGPTNEYF